jgi:hypothetical protein
VPQSFVDGSGAQVSAPQLLPASFTVAGTQTASTHAKPAAHPGQPIATPHESTPTTPQAPAHAFARHVWEAGLLGSAMQTVPPVHGVPHASTSPEHGSVQRPQRTPDGQVVAGVQASALAPSTCGGLASPSRSVAESVGGCESIATVASSTVLSTVAASSAVASCVAAASSAVVASSTVTSFSGAPGDPSDRAGFASAWGVATEASVGVTEASAPSSEPSGPPSNPSSLAGVPPHEATDMSGAKATTIATAKRPTRP